jgi:hypothetical protein
MFPMHGGEACCSSYTRPTLPIALGRRLACDLHKTSVAGGNACTMELPNTGADGALVAERNWLLFLDDRRLSFA